VIGALCGYSGGRLDRAVGRFVDVLMAFRCSCCHGDGGGARQPGREHRHRHPIINLPFYIRFARAEVNVRRNLAGSRPRAPRREHTSVVLRLSVAQRTAGDGGADVAQSRLGHHQRRRSFLHRARFKAPTRNGDHGRGGARFISTGKWWLVAFPGMALMLAVVMLQPARRRFARHPRSQTADMSATGTTNPLLQIDNLHVTFSTSRPGRGGARRFLVARGRRDARHRRRKRSGKSSPALR